MPPITLRPPDRSGGRFSPSRRRAAAGLTLAALLSACAGLPDQTAPAQGMVETWRGDDVVVAQAESFDPEDWRGLRLGEVAIEAPEDASPSDLETLEEIRLALLEALEATPIAETVAQPRRLAAARPPRRPLLVMDAVISDVATVRPALNVASTLLIGLPLDTGGMTLTTRYRDREGELQAERIERLSGSVWKLANAFSSHAHLDAAARDWAEECGRWPGCVEPPQG